MQVLQVRVALPGVILNQLASASAWGQQLYPRAAVHGRHGDFGISLTGGCGTTVTSTVRNWLRYTRSYKLIHQAINLATGRVATRANSHSTERNTLHLLTPWP